MIYLDNASTTRPSRAAISAVTEALSESWGNPSSRHDMGRVAAKKVEAAKMTILETLGARRAPSSSLIFTGSGTEATNLAILGVCRSKKRRGRIIVGEGEHASVESCVTEAEKEGFEVVRIPTAGGEIDISALKEAVNEDTVLASFMLVNNETGARYNVEEAFSVVKSRSSAAILHCDAVQGYMKVPFTVKSLGADMITISAHKIHGPKGIGALYVDQNIFKRREISPVIFGGGQEGGMRSGTVNVPAVLGFAAAAAEMYGKRAENIEKTESLRQFAVKMFSEINGVRCNIPKDPAPHILSVTVDGIKSETMLHFLSGEGIAVSSGSACSSHSKKLSGALSAFGLCDEEADTTIRISFSEENSELDVKTAAQAISSGILKLAKIKK